MEQHPIPQNVTTFQFRLIGDMTIKQFGYLAGGAIAGYICYKMPFPFFITLPLTVISVLLGVGLAFVPIEERPMDIWILSFIKSIYSPTLYIWQKTQTPEMPQDKSVSTIIPKKDPGYGQFGAIPGLNLAMALSGSVEAFIAKTMPKPGHASGQVTPPASMPPNPAQPVLEKLFTPPARLPVPSVATDKTIPQRVNVFDRLTALFFPKKTPSPFSPHAGSPADPSLTGSQHNAPLPPVQKSPIDTSPQEPRELQEVQKTQFEVTHLQQTVDNLKKELENRETSEGRILALQEQLMEAIKHREKMETELIELRKKVEKKTPPPIAAYTAPNAKVANEIPTIRVVTSDVAPKLGLPRLTTYPNVVTGLVKDNEGNLLPGVLITVRDKEDVPLRALKSNKLGQFASPMPLPNGKYFIEVEDPRNRYIFDRAQITLTGVVMPALEIIAKSQKEVARAKLAKEIFGNHM